jgi:hypothetical protein
VLLFPLAYISVPVRVQCHSFSVNTNLPIPLLEETQGRRNSRSWGPGFVSITTTSSAFIKQLPRIFPPVWRRNIMRNRKFYQYLSEGAIIKACTLLFWLSFNKFLK